MMKSFQVDIETLKRRPELQFGPNPLIEAAAEFVPFSEWPKKLRRYPLEKVDWKALPPAYREPHLAYFKEHFAPHRRLSSPAADLQNIFRRGLVRFNPAAAEGRLRLLKTQDVKDKTALRSLAILSPLDGGGGIWDGITATGRSALVLRILEIIAPRQVITLDRPRGSAAVRVTVLLYLYIDFPSNGTRGGLLKRILSKLDDALGTSWSDELRRVTNIDVLLVEVCKKLASVRCVLLIIDEKQGSNFEESPWQVEFVLFYILLMNMGINVFLIGNPLAFVHLQLFSQVMRRFSAAGQHPFLPAGDQNEEWWAEDFAPRMRKFSLVDGWDIDPKRQQAIEYENSGGLPGLDASLHTEVQKVAIRRAGSAPSATVKEADYVEAVQSPTYKELQRIALSLGDTGDDSVLPYLDMPSRPRQPRETSSQTNASKLIGTLDDRTLDVVKKLLAKFTREAASGTRKLVDKLESLKGLDPDDLRLLGVSKEHLDEMSKLKDRIEEESKKKAKGGRTRTPKGT